MKTIGFSIVLSLALQVSLQAEPDSQPALPSTNALPATVAPTIVARSASSRIWASITSQTNADGQVSHVTNNSYIELASGLCYQSNGIWLDAVEQIDIVADGAAATQAQHTVHFAGNANTAGGAVHLVTSDGKVFDSRVYGLSYWDSASGSNVLLAPLQDSAGVVVGNNRVVYTNAFKGLNADLEYVFTKGGLEQNIIYREQPPSPASVGLNPQSTRLQVFTEFFSPPAPQKRSLVVKGVPEDSLIDFGAMAIGVGRAFVIPSQAAPGGGRFGPVSKHWTQLDGRNFLIEEVPYPKVSNAMQNLPVHASSGPVGNGVKNLAALEPLLPQMVVPKRMTPDDQKVVPTGKAKEFASADKMQRVKSLPEQPGVVQDYTIINWGTISSNFVFQCDTTYYISAGLVFHDTPTFEGGTVVKVNDMMINYGASPFIFNGSSYRPVVLTSPNDNSVGDTISGSTGSPSWFGAYYLYEASATGATGVTLSHLRCSYAGQAYEDDYDQSHIFQDCQFVQCYLLTTLPSDTYVYFGNDLIAGCNEFMYDVGCEPGYFTLDAENITADSIGTFEYQDGGGVTCSGGITNSILTDCDSSVTDFNLDTTLQAASGSGIYQTVGAGNYYLVTGSTNRNAGNININPALWADLQTKTTYPPVVYSNTTISLAANFGITAYRETNAQPDIGYAYEPLDLVFGGTSIGSNVTFGPGVAVGWFNAASKGYGIFMSNTMIASFEGTATAPVWWVRANTVQEALSTGLWPGAGTVGGLVGEDSQYTGNITLSPEAHLNFTRCSVLADGEQNSGQHFRDDFGYLIVRATNSEFYGGHLSGYIISCFFTNCFMDRLQGGQIAGWNSDQWMMRNCTWHGGSLGLDPYATAMPISIRDCTFDGTFTQALDYATNSGNADYDYNAFTNTSGEFPVGGWFDVIVTSGFNWQSSWFGNYYLPSNSALMNVGDVTADQLGLFHFTTQTNQAPQGFAQVDIGYHYVATDGYGNPLDTSGDGLPDYIADSNGDGVYDAGDIANWLNPFTIFDQGVSYGGYYPANVRLGYWKFDTNTLASQAGYGPIYSNTFSRVATWSGDGISMNNTLSHLYYNMWESTTPKWTNLTLANGTVRFWYQPNWSTGDPSAPTFAMLMEAGGGGSPYGDWQLTIAYGSTIVFGSGNANDGENPFWASISLESDHWYQMTLTYSPTNMAFYTNGVLLCTATVAPFLAETSPVTNPPVWTVADGVIYYPSDAFLAGDSLQGFSFGNSLQTAGSSGSYAAGQFDELETFNYPLTAQAVAAGFPTFAGASIPNTLDSDYDGRSDLLETLVDGGVTNNSSQVVPCRLGYWRFDSPLLFAEQGQVPKSQSGVTLTNSWSGTAANIGSASASHLTYWDVYTNGWANINCRAGSVRFWFKPNGWTSGSESGSAPFIYLGNATPSTGEWALQTTSSGSTIELVTASNGTSVVNVSAALSLTNSANWQQIVLTYGPNGSAIYTNGVLAGTNSTAVTLLPNATDRANGMIIGNNTALNASINGQFDELETFDYLLTPADIAANFRSVQAVDTDLDGVPDLLEDIRLPTNRPFLSQPVMITGTVEAEQFDQGGPGVAYSNVVVNPTVGYRNTGMFITNCNDLGGGYSLNETRSNEWVTYSIYVLVPGTYTVETRVEGIGTNGAFRFSFANSSGTTYAYITNQVIPTTTWTNVAANVTLAAGLNTMKLYFVTNGQVSGVYGTNVGNFNYISLYPWWQAGVPNITYTRTLSTNSTAGLYTLIPGTNNSWYAATNNGIQIQNAVNDVAFNGGGRVQIPAGTFMIAWTNPVEANPAYENAAVTMLTNNIEIAGLGPANTTLIAFNRATTIFSLGYDQFNNSFAFTNFTLRDITIEAQPHRAVNNRTNSIFASAQLQVSGGGDPTGTPVIIYGNFTSQRPDNILITNCQFLAADYSIEVYTCASNVMVRNCSFTIWGGFDTWGTNNVYPATTGYGGSVGIYTRGDSVYNLVVLENTYNGNILIPCTNTNTSVPFPLSQVATTNYQNVTGPDGLLWVQGGGNVFAARNAITNNRLEAIQFNSGPNSEVGNVFYTRIQGSALTDIALWPDAIGSETALNDYSTTFIGNWVYGEQEAVNLLNSTTVGVLPTSFNCSGNWINLCPALQTTGNLPSAAVNLEICPNANVFGNKLVSGGHGLLFYQGSTNAVVMDNDFGAASYRGIGYLTFAYFQTPASLPHASVFRNILGQGATFNAEMIPVETGGWFFSQNTYLNAASNSVAPFFDPANAYVHLSN